MKALFFYSFTLISDCIEFMEVLDEYLMKYNKNETKLFLTLAMFNPVYFMISLMNSLCNLLKINVSMRILLKILDSDEIKITQH